MRLRKICAVLAALVLVFSAAGCNTNKINTADSKKEKLTGNIIVYGEKADQKAVQSFINGFTKLNPGMKINFKALSTKELVSEACVKFNDDKPGKNEPVKLIILKDCYIQKVLSQKSSTYINLTKKFSDYKSDFKKTILSNLTYENNLYAIPFSESPEALIIRKDILEKYGIDQNDIITWDDLVLDGSNILTKSKQSINILGIYNDNEDSLFNLMFNQINVSYTTDAENEESNTEKEKKILKKIEYMNFQKILLNTDLNKCINSLKTGKLLSLYASPEIAFKIMENCPELKGKLQVMKVPSFEPGGNEDTKFSGKSVMIRKSDADSDAALEFVKYITTDIAAEVKAMKSSGYFPANSEVLNDKYINKKVQFYNNQYIWMLYSDIYTNSWDTKYPKDYDIQKIKSDAALKKILSGTGNLNAALSQLGK